MSEFDPNEVERDQPSNDKPREPVERISVPRQPLQTIYDAILSGAFYEDYDAASKMTGWLRVMLEQSPVTQSAAGASKYAAFLPEAIAVLGEMFEVADTEGMDDETVIPVWPADVAKDFSPFKVKHVRAILRHFNTPQSATERTPHPREVIIETFRSMPANWDSYGADKFTDATINLALRISKLLEDDWKAVPCADGPSVWLYRGDEEEIIEVRATDNVPDRKAKP